MMTKSGFDLDEIERLLAAATPGEWERRGLTLWQEGASALSIAVITQHQRKAHNDAALIVALHNSAPAMLTEIRELRAENARLREDGSMGR